MPPRDRSPWAEALGPASCPRVPSPAPGPISHLFLSALPPGSTAWGECPHFPFCTLPGSPEVSLGKHWAVLGACGPTWAPATTGLPLLCVNCEEASAWPTLWGRASPVQGPGSGSGVGRCLAPETPRPSSPWEPVSFLPWGESGVPPRHLPAVALLGVDVRCLWESSCLEQWADGCRGRCWGGEPWPLVDGRFGRAGAGEDSRPGGGGLTLGFSSSPPLFPAPIPRRAFQRRAFCLFLLRSH